MSKGVALFVVLFLGMVVVAGVVLTVQRGAPSRFDGYCAKKWEGWATRYQSGSCQVMVDGRWVPESNVLVTGSRP